MTGSRRWLVAFAASLVLMLGCFVGGGQPDREAPGGAPSGVSGASARATDADSLERDVEGAVAVADQYWREQFAAAGLGFTPVRRIISYPADGQVQCAGQSIPAH